jgi:hypothetical protein
MNDKIIAKSERSITNTILIIVGIILFSFIIYLLNNNFHSKNEYEEKLKIFGLIILSSLTTYCVYYLLNQKKIIVYHNYFEVKNSFHVKRYNFAEIATHYSEYFEGKYNSWTEYYLIFNTNEKITLIDSEYSNFNDFFSKIKINVKENKVLNTKLLKPKFLKYSIICGIISFIIFYFSSYFYDFNTIKNSDFNFFTSLLQNEIKVVKESKGKKHFEFALVDQPQFLFKITGSSYESINNNNQFINSFEKGSKITIGIKKDEYDRKISKQKALSFIDKYLHYATIQVEQVKNSENKFLIDLKIINKLKIESNYIGIGFFSFFGLFFLFLSAGNLKAHIKSKRQT